MRVIFSISQSKFEKAYQEMSLLNQTDFYTVGGGMYSATTQHSGDLKTILDMGYSSLEVTLLDVSPKQYPDDFWVRKGFSIKPNSAVYRTSGNNIHGVYKTDSDEYYAFYSGSRSRSQDLLNLGVVSKHDVPLEVISSAPSIKNLKDIYWYETVAECIIRINKGTVAITYLAENYDSIEDINNFYGASDILSFYQTKDAFFLEYLDCAMNAYITADV